MLKPVEATKRKGRAMIIIPDKLRRPAEVERDELRKHLAEAKAEIERLNKHWSRVEERLNGMLYHSDWNLDAAQTIIKRKDKLIEQMREALKAIDAIGSEKGDASRDDALRCFSIASAALAAERGE
jgi:predicted  nucleic acid-binding Zn-ribbon protein